MTVSAAELEDMRIPVTEHSGDEVVGALDALNDAIEQNWKDQRQLQERIEGLREARRSGVQVTSALRQEQEPGTMQLLGRVLSRLMESSGTLRRSLAKTMRSEGTSIPAIARLFGVTHQRVSNILNRPTAMPAPALHETGVPSGAAQGPAGEGPSGSHGADDEQRERAG